MKNPSKEYIKQKLKTQILRNVNKPARYTGGEFNIAHIKDAPVSFAIAFPDIYEVGMSHLGMKILYSLLNDKNNCSCERVYAPMPDMAGQLQEHGLPLYTLETYKPLNRFDFVGFSIQYEMCVTNVLYMLDLGRIPIFAKDRSDEDPIVIAGGPCTVNPEPFCDFFDVIIIGEAEELLPALIDEYEKCKRNKRTKTEFLEKICAFEGVYIPSFYSVEYDGSGRVTSRDATNACAPKSVKRVFIKDINASHYPEKIIVPFIEIVHDRAVTEIMRGCARGCRFCQAGFIYRPVRMKSIDTVKRQTDGLLRSSGYEEVSLSSLSSSDYIYCEEAVSHVMQNYSDKRVNVSLPSLRIDSFSVNLAAQMRKGKKGSITFAPEAGSQRMRDIINKNLTEEQILSTVSEVFGSGCTKMKLYFMIGLPFETDEDVLGISALINKIIDKYFACRQSKALIDLSVSVACFVPKPFTPFQFFGQDPTERLMRKQKLLISSMNKKVKLNYTASSLSTLEAAFARGDRRLNSVIMNAYEMGCVFDAWDEYYRPDKWEKAFEKEGLDFNMLALRKFDHNDNLPWDFIDIGIEKEFLIREAEKAAAMDTTQSCFEKCSQCGIATKYGRCDFEV